MDSLLQSLSLLLTLSYVGVASVYGVVFFRREPWADKAATPALRSLSLLHFLYLVVLGFRWHQLPMASVPQALSAIAFAVAVVCLYLEHRDGDRSTGFWMLTLAFVFQLLSVLLARPEPPYRDLFHNPLFAIHVSLALLSYASFAVAAVHGFLYIRLYHELKRGHFSLLFGKLPPLEALERKMSRALRLGFLALTGAILDGLFWAQRLGFDGWYHDPKVLFTSGLWAIYAVTLAGRRSRTWRPRQTAAISVGGLIVILLSLFVVNVLFTRFHGFY
jgi:ABC-type uncharacterized transport system permease subunit